MLHALTGNVYLGGITEETAIDAVKGQAKTGPVLEKTWHFFGEITKGKTAHARSLRGENSRGQWTDLYAHRGENGDNECQGSATKTGKIVDSADTFDGIGGSSVILQVTSFRKAKEPIKKAPNGA